MPETRAGENPQLIENTKNSKPVPQKSDSVEEWETYLKEAGLSTNRGEITLSILARFGEKKSS